MKPTTVNRRGRALASLTAALGLALATATTVGTGSAQSAAPTPDCTPYAGTLTEGDPVRALSVTSGTAPQTFTGEYLGTFNDGIAPGVDMIMIEITPPDPSTMRGVKGVDGIWQGMSGSPVYAADGTVVGAIAYGLAWGPSWFAGVTPFADMDKYLTDAAPANVPVSHAVARTIARSSDVTQAQAEQGFTQLPMPTGVSGMQRGLAKAARQRDDHPWLPKDTYKMGAAATADDPNAAGPETVVPGGNLAASLSYGDITMGGVGTVTAVCNGKVVGFGHPMTFLGKTTLTLHPAKALFIQPESLGAPFKLANLGAPAGTITDDHLTGITGFVDVNRTPDTTDISSTVNYGGDTRTGASHVSVPEGTAATVFYESIANHDVVVDGAIKGSELKTWQITGTDSDGTPFDLQVTDRYASDWDITFEAAWELADFVWSLSAIPGVTIDNVTMTSDVTDDSSVWEIAKLEQRVAGEWVKAGKGAPVLARAGKPLPLRAVLTSGGSAPVTVPVSVTVPATASGSEGRVEVTGGAYLWSRNAYPRSVAQAQKYVDTLVRNDQIQVSLGLFAKRHVIRDEATSAPQDKVVTGRKAVRVFVK